MFVAVGLMTGIPVVSQAGACSGSHVKSPGVIQKSEFAVILEMVDLNKVNPEKSVEQDLANLESTSFFVVAQSRASLLRRIISTPGNIESGQILKERFEQLRDFDQSKFSEEVELFESDGIRTRPKEFSDKKFHSDMAASDVRKVLKGLFELAIFRVAAQQPFMVLTDPRVYPILSEQVFSSGFGGYGMKFDDPFPRHFNQIVEALRVRKEDEFNKLKESRAFALAARTPEARKFWTEWLGLMSRMPDIGHEDLIEFGKLLKIDFKPVIVPVGEI